MRITEAQLRKIIRRELDRLDEAQLTVGDVKAALKYAKGKKMKAAAAEAAKEAGKKAGMLGVKSVLSLFPGAAAVAEYIETGMELKDIYSAAKSAKPNEKESNPLWDMLTIDPDISSIVDDEVESRFVSDLADRVSNLPDETALPDADEQLANWLKRKFSGAHITKGE